MRSRNRPRYGSAKRWSKSTGSQGKRVELPIQAGSTVTVAGVFRDYAQHGAVLIDRADYVALTGDRTVNDGALWLVPVQAR